MILARILFFPGTRTDSIFSRYSPGFYLFPLLGWFCHFSVLTQIRPYSGICPDSFSILARILRFPATRPNTAIFWYSHRFDRFPILVGYVFRYSHGFHLYPVLARILLIFGTRKDSTIFRYSSGQFFDTRTDSTFSRYLPEYCHF